MKNCPSYSHEQATSNSKAAGFLAVDVEFKKHRLSIEVMPLTGDRVVL